MYAKPPQPDSGQPESRRPDEATFKQPEQPASRQPDLSQSRAKQPYDLKPDSGQLLSGQSAPQQPNDDKPDSGRLYPLRRPSWRNLAIYFCVFSLLGHWLEIIYSTFMRIFFDVYDPESLVWDDWLYPFLIYGIGVVVNAYILVPFKDLLSRFVKSQSAAVALCFAAATLLSLLMELVMGLLLNRPDSSGVYPLWDNSNLPLNVFGQAWLVNDLALGALATFYTWVIYPWSEKCLNRLPKKIMSAATTVVVSGFVVLCFVKFT